MRILILATLVLLVRGNALAAPTPKVEASFAEPYSIALANSGLDVVHLDLENATAAEALKQIFDQVKQKYVLDPDVPESGRISVHAQNVKLFTALDLLCQAAGVNWGQEIQDGRPLFRIGKSVPPVQGYRTLFVPQRQQIRGAGVVTTFTPMHVPMTVGAPTNSSTAGPVIRSGDTLYTLTLDEARSTFTCPHCQGKVMVIGRREQPTCPKCGRVFQSDWKFCPADGTARPPAPSDWRFCPLCGKAVR